MHNNMKEIKQKKFYLIGLITTYAFLKEHYSDIRVGIEKQSSDDIDSIIALLHPLEKFVTMPDKRDSISKGFAELTKIYCCDSIGKEATFFQNIHEYAKILDIEEKDEILNILLYVINIDDKITHAEKETLLQVADSFGIEHNYDKLLSSYKKSALKKPLPLLKMSLIASIMILPLLGILYYFSLLKNDGTINLFDDKKVMFSKISFNRFIIYQNKYESENSHFAKQVVFNIHGTAEVGFEPKNITYETTTKVLTYHLPPSKPYKIEISSEVDKIDQADPVELSKEEAKKLAAGIAIVGGLAGASVGKSLGSFYPGSQGKIAGSIVGGLGGGIVSGFIAFNSLNGLQVSENISRKEGEEIKEYAKERIKNLLELSPELTHTYKRSFERYIKALYVSHGFEVKKIKYDKSFVGKNGV